MSSETTRLSGIGGARLPAKYRVVRWCGDLVENDAETVSRAALVGGHAVIRLVLLAMGMVAIAGCAVAPSPSVPAATQPLTSLQPIATPAAALTPTSTPLPSPTPSPSPAATPTGEVRWDRVADVEVPPASVVISGHDSFSVAGFEDGYVIADPGLATVQFSPDGVTWTPVKLPHAKGATVGVNAVVADGARVLAVGSYTPCSLAAWRKDAWGRCRGRPASWVSDDGRTWRSSGQWSGSVGPAGQGGSAFLHAWVVPTGGWDVAQGWYSGDDTDVGVWVGPALWHSDDGIAWSQLRGKPVEPAAECDPYMAADFFRAVADADGRRVALAYADSYAGGCDEDLGQLVSISADGRRYEPLDGYPDDGRAARAALAPTGGGPWLFVGDRKRSGFNPEANWEALAWTTHDLRTWSTSVLPVPADTRSSGVSNLGRSTIGYVATGGVSPESRAITWLSDDGLSWRIADVRPSVDLSLDELVDGPAGMLGLGERSLPDATESDAYQLIVWRLRDLR
jgi:hypothetical protein